MKKMDYSLEPLSLHFSQDFLPERSLLARLLPFAAAKGSGDKEFIGSETGIPTGKSSGKVEPMIHYACGMGLIRSTQSSGLWQLELTALGKIVLTEDPYLNETVTLWLLHLLFCRRNSLDRPATGLADAWYALFAEGTHRLGETFDQKSFLTFLTERHGSKSYLKGLSGLVLRSYFEPTCFQPIKALSAKTSEKQTLYSRQNAPIDSSYFPAYSSYLFQIWDDLFAGHNQLSVEELLKESRCGYVMGWDQRKVSMLLDWMADRRLLQLDRQTGGTLALRLQDTDSVVSEIYSELI
jgi:hypothetical protein